VEVAEKWEVVIKVGWEFDTKVVKKWESGSQSGVGGFTVEVVFAHGVGSLKQKVVEKWEVAIKVECGIYSRSGGRKMGRGGPKQMGHLLGI